MLSVAVAADAGGHLSGHRRGAIEVAGGARRVQQRVSDLPFHQARRPPDWPVAAWDFGAKSGARQGFASSRALKNAGVTWDDKTLDRFIENSRLGGAQQRDETVWRATPDAAARQQIVEYLKRRRVADAGPSPE